MVADGHSLIAQPESGLVGEVVIFGIGGLTSGNDTDPLYSVSRQVKDHAHHRVIGVEEVVRFESLLDYMGHSYSRAFWSPIPTPAIPVAS